MKKLILMRGLPWTGKSYRAKELSESHDNAPIYSTDEFWYKIRKPHLPEEYSFNPLYLEYAHKWNQQRAFRDFEIGAPCVIIDNTNTTLREMEVYINYARPQEYEIQIEEPTSDRWKEISELLRDKNQNREKLKAWAIKLEAGSAGIHNVPCFAIERMMWRWECTKEILEVLNLRSL